MLIKAVIFDLYGTLVSVKNKTNPYKILFDAAVANKDDRIVELVLSRSFLKTADQEMSISGGVSDKQEEFNNKLKVEIDSTKVYPETIELLQKLKDLNYVVGVISNSSTPYKEPFYRLGLDVLTDHNIFSCDVGCMKPSREIYELMQKKIAVDFKEIIMVGDSLRCDVLGPKAVGMNSILLDRHDLFKEKEKIKNLNEIFRLI